MTCDKRLWTFRTPPNLVNGVPGCNEMSSTFTLLMCFRFLSARPLAQRVIASDARPSVEADSSSPQRSVCTTASTTFHRPAECTHEHPASPAARYFTGSTSATAFAGRLYIAHLPNHLFQSCKPKRISAHLFPGRARQRGRTLLVRHIRDSVCFISRLTAVQQYIGRSDLSTVTNGFWRPVPAVYQGVLPGRVVAAGVAGGLADAVPTRAVH